MAGAERWGEEERMGVFEDRDVMRESSSTTSCSRSV